MNTVPQTARLVAAILLGVLVGGLSFWLVHSDDAKRFDALKARALCVLDLPAGTSTVSAAFTNSRSIDRFQLALKTKAADQPLSVSISGDQGLVGSASSVKAGWFGLGTQIQPGNYTLTIGQQTRGKGGTIVLADAAPVFVTGWQIWSRTYAGLLVVSTICVLLLRKAQPSRTRALSFTAFHSLLLGFVLIFVYLLFHEGGHALFEIAFGHFDPARSDFWGIHGHPHSGGSMGPQPKPWQQTLISCAGPMLPTLAGFALFVLWALPLGRKLRSVHPMLNLYFSALVASLVFSDAVCKPLYLLGLITAEGDPIGYAATTGGPVWLVTGFLGGVFILSALILCRVGPEIWHAWTARFLPPRASAPRPPQLSVHR